VSEVRSMLRAGGAAVAARSRLTRRAAGGNCEKGRSRWPHIFDRFFRGRTASPSGTGIGLAVVAELARAHGGTAEASSQPGQGATFTIRLPAQVI